MSEIRYPEECKMIDLEISNTMEEQLILFDTAKLAKEKNFDIPCTKVYNTIGELWNSHYKDMKNSDPDSGACCTAPTQSLLQKWLRIKHDIHVEPTLNFTSDKFPMHFNCGVMTGISSVEAFKWAGIESSYTFYKKYEEALEAGLIEGLKLIENK